MRHLPKAFRKQEELYVLRNWSRADIDVLLRLDASKLKYDAYPDDPDVVQLYTEAVSWALGLTEGDERTHAERN